MPADTAKQLGRSAARIASLIRNQINRGKLAAGDFVPSGRYLAEVHAVDSKTIWRAMKSLEAEGLVASEPRRGYRVLPRANDPDRGSPLAYVYWDEENAHPWMEVANLRHSAFQSAAARRGWTLLVAKTNDWSRGQLLERLRAVRSCGVALDMHNPELVEFFKGSGLPVVQVNTWTEDSAVDTVNHDGQQGGLLAARYLAGRGHRRIAWFGLLNYTGHSIDRYGGALIGLRRAGLDFAPELTIDVTDRTSVLEKARALLSRPDRPEAIIAPWHDRAAALARAADELGLVVGEDFEMVGWAPEELYERIYASAFKEGEVPPAIVWSAAELAESAVERLAARRAHPELPAQRIKVPVRLRLADG